MIKVAGLRKKSWQVQKCCISQTIGKSFQKLQEARAHSATFQVPRVENPCLHVGPASANCSHWLFTSKFTTSLRPSVRAASTQMEGIHQPQASLSFFTLELYHGQAYPRQNAGL